MTADAIPILREENKALKEELSILKEQCEELTEMFDIISKASNTKVTPENFTNVFTEKAYEAMFNFQKCLGIKMVQA
jgi:cell division septum initiation protein DivIVA